MMKFLTALFLLISVSAFGAVPAYTSFRGTGGILITSNPPTGNITIDGSGVFTTSGTNATVAISTNGVLVMVAATNVNFITGSNVFLAATNIGSTAHLGINAFTPVPFIEGAVTNLLLTWILPILTVDSLTVSNLLAAPPLSSVQYNSNGVTRGSAGFIYTNGQVRVADIVVAGQGMEVTAGSFVLNGGDTALVAWNGLGRMRWPTGGVARLEDDAALSFNRLQLGGDTAAFPAIGRTNGDVIILGANGAFKAGDATNKLRAPAVFIANDGGMGTPLLRLENPLNAMTWDVAINSHSETYFLGLGRVGEANYAMVWELGGNVGIGITNPTVRLDVQGRFMARSNVYFPNISSNATPVALLVTDSDGQVYEGAIPTVAASAETNSVLTNIIGTVAGNVTNVVSLSTTNATSKPLTNAYANGVLTLFGLEAGANVTVIPNGSNLVIAATGGGGGGAGSFAVNDNQFITNSLLNFKSGALVTNLSINTSTNTGHVYFLPDNTYDIGASGATRPRTIYAGTDVRAGSELVAGVGVNIAAVGYVFFNGRAIIRSPSDGVLSLLNNAETSVNRLNLGGNTAAFPSIGRTNGDLIILGADGGFGAVATNRLHLPGGLVMTNANVAAGKVWTAVGGLGGGTWSNAPAAGGGAVAWASNSIPFMNPAGNALVFYNPGNSLSNGGFGFHPIGPHGGGAYGGLRVFSDYSSGLLTIGHPNPGSAFATFVTALSVSNAYAGTGFKQEMSKYDATDVSEGSDPSSTFVTYRTWSGGTPTIAAEVRKDGMGFFSHGTMYQSNSLASTMPTAAELGPGGYWAGVSNTSFVVVHSANGTTTSMKVLSP